LTNHAAAQSISRPVAETLWRDPPIRFRVLAAFELALDLVGSGEWGRKPVVALVAPQIGDGPLNVVLEANGWSLAAVEAGAPAHRRGERLQVEGLEVDLSQAKIWEPRPDWPALRPRRRLVRARLASLQALASQHAPAGSFLVLLTRSSPGGRCEEATAASARLAADALESGWRGNRGRLEEGVARLAGLGAGLTPGGDDFLCGAMLGAWIAHPTPAPLCHTIARLAAPRTTTLSHALLWAAAQGECSAAWHDLLEGLVQGDDARIARGLQQMLDHGATSGADALAGFLWAARIEPRGSK
jgi:hypothetical protein